MTTRTMTTSTESSKGWAWILRDRWSADKATDHQDAFDGVYVAGCPACGQDTIWNAFRCEPLCNCGQASS